MTWSQWKAATQLLAEESPVGAPLRAEQRAAQAAEDAEVAATKAAIRKTMPQPPPRSFPELQADAQTIGERARLRTVQPRTVTDEVLG